MSQHPLADTLALLILAQRDHCPAASISLVVQIVLDRYLPKWEDERIADLYALIVERLEAQTAQHLISHAVLARQCSDAFNEHDARWEALREPEAP